MTKSAAAGIGMKVLSTAVVIAEATMHGSMPAVKRFVDMNPDARGTAPCVGEKENPNSA